MLFSVGVEGQKFSRGAFVWSLAFSASAWKLAPEQQQMQQMQQQQQMQQMQQMQQQQQQQMQQMQQQQQQQMQKPLFGARATEC